MKEESENLLYNVSTVIKTISKKKNARRQSDCLWRFYKAKEVYQQLRKEEKQKEKEKGKDIPKWMQSSRE